MHADDCIWYGQEPQPVSGHLHSLGIDLSVDRFKQRWQGLDEAKVLDKLRARFVVLQHLNAAVLQLVPAYPATL